MPEGEAMPIELVALLAGAKALPGIVDACATAAASIRGRFGANDRAKQALEAQLDDLRASLASVGALAEAGDAYIDALDQLRHLEHDVLLLDQYVSYNVGALQNHRSPTHDGAWQAVGQLVGAIDRDRDLPLQVHLNRKDWFDAADDQMLGSRLNEVNIAYSVLDERSRARRFGDVRSAIEALKKPITETTILLRGTLTERIVAGLRDLRLPGAPSADDRTPRPT